ncbi:MAG: type II toxin-antitoxin system HicB family antitoxin [Sneathiella sp.]
MNGMMKYKGYFGSVSYDEADKILHGKIEFIRDLVTYEGSDVAELETMFQEAVDDYLDLCATEKKDPDLPFKGTFNVRTGTDLHRQAALYAKQHNINLNKVVIEALEQFLPS